MKSLGILSILLLLALALSANGTDFTQKLSASRLVNLRSAVAVIDTATWDQDVAPVDTNVTVVDNRLGFQTIALSPALSAPAATVTLTVVRGNWDGFTFTGPYDQVTQAFTATALGTLASKYPAPSVALPTGGATGLLVLVTGQPSSGTVDVNVRLY